MFALHYGIPSQAQLEEQEATIVELRRKLAEESAKGTIPFPCLPKASFPSHGHGDEVNDAGTTDGMMRLSFANPAIALAD